MFKYASQTGKWIKITLKIAKKPAVCVMSTCLCCDYSDSSDYKQHPSAIKKTSHE